MQENDGCHMLNKSSVLWLANTTSRNNLQCHIIFICGTTKLYTCLFSLTFNFKELTT